MLANVRAWNLWCGLLAKEQQKPVIDVATDDASDKWIWYIWFGVALLAVAILPFSSRLNAFADAFSSFCGGFF